MLQKKKSRFERRPGSRQPQTSIADMPRSLDTVTLPDGAASRHRIVYRRLISKIGNRVRRLGANGDDEGLPLT